MQLTHRPSKILITGRSGSGKSTYFTRYVLQSKYRYRFVFDHEGEFSVRTKAPAALTTAQLVDQLTGRRCVVYDPSEMFPGSTPTAFAFFSEWTFSVCEGLPGSKLYACDELQKLTGTNCMPWELACVVETGRRRGLDLVAISIAPNLVHNRVRNALTEVVTFGHSDENAIAFLVDVGFDADQIRALDPGQFIARSLVTGAEDRGKVF